MEGGRECSLLSARELRDSPRGGQVGLASLLKAAAALAGNVSNSISRPACELVPMALTLNNQDILMERSYSGLCALLNWGFGIG